MTVLVTGARGQLGHDVLCELTGRHIKCIGVDREDFDITDKDATLRYISNLKPDSIIHCAAYTNVDMAEEDREKQICFDINVNGTENVAAACKITGAKLVYISTDYVFDGKKCGEYDVNDMPNPVGVYGLSKYYGENCVKKILDKYFIIRTSWMFGKNGDNFIKKILRKAENQRTLEVVDDQIGSPTYTVDLSRLIADMIITEKYGTYHATNEGFCSWAEFASEILKIYKRGNVVKYVGSESYKSKAIRPMNSKLNKNSLDNAGFNRLPSWQDALKRYFNEE